MQGTLQWRAGDGVSRQREQRAEAETKTLFGEQQQGQGWNRRSAEEVVGAGIRQGSKGQILQATDRPRRGMFGHLLTGLLSACLTVAFSSWQRLKETSRDHLIQPFSSQSTQIQNLQTDGCYLSLHLPTLI